MSVQLFMVPAKSAGHGNVHSALEWLVSETLFESRNFVEWKKRLGGLGEIVHSQSKHEHKVPADGQNPVSRAPSGEPEAASQAEVLEDAAALCMPSLYLPATCYRRKLPVASGDIAFGLSMEDHCEKLYTLEKRHQPVLHCASAQAALKAKICVALHLLSASADVRPTLSPRMSAVSKTVCVSMHHPPWLWNFARSPGEEFSDKGYARADMSLSREFVSTLRHRQTDQWLGGTSAHGKSGADRKDLVDSQVFGFGSGVPWVYAMGSLQQSASLQFDFAVIAVCAGVGRGERKQGSWCLCQNQVLSFQRPQKQKLRACAVPSPRAQVD
ncbi:hypothetical protein AK812_SmicGene15612 [Symbiodinium microadriaticum]|uniref:Uncharacterized protein n=1 Tax=Symbiodinium microadriaticum TaxID=2951 RepID=A0A1Q9E2L6_SYMMI|nr:hypothetical protein AK812_SmicGene15612 [Symbiodinium microadriaticum]